MSKSDSAIFVGKCDSCDKQIEWPYHPGNANHTKPGVHIRCADCGDTNWIERSWENENE